MPKFVARFRGRCAPQCICKRLTDLIYIGFRDEDHSFRVHMSGALEEFLVYVLSNESRLRIVSISRVIAGLIMIIIS